MKLIPLGFGARLTSLYRDSLEERNTFTFKRACHVPRRAPSTFSLRATSSILHSIHRMLQLEIRFEKVSKHVRNKNNSYEWFVSFKYHNSADIGVITLSLSRQSTSSTYIKQECKRGCVRSSFNGKACFAVLRPKRKRRMGSPLLSWPQGTKVNIDRCNEKSCREVGAFLWVPLINFRKSLLTTMLATSGQKDKKVSYVSMDATYNYKNQRHAYQRRHERTRWLEGLEMGIEEIVW
ncbi:hypothetical protein V1478_003094 [Vespula squamosa]|uniref:Uncharacterized protein n=1 Tax=Vespula squamosa TaxID=30214 RepID=A0ABD2BRP9_VESSQ